MTQRDLTHLSAFLDQLRPLIPEPAAAQFNLLNILQVSSREVPICRLLAALMEPNGAHGLASFPDAAVSDRYSGAKLSAGRF